MGAGSSPRNHSILVVYIFNCTTKRFIYPTPTKVLAFHLNGIGLQAKSFCGQTKFLSVLVKIKWGSLVKAQRIFPHSIRMEK